MASNTEKYSGHALPDRRTFSWRTVFYGYLRSRRVGTGSGYAADEMFGDWHHPWLFFLATGIMLLSCADAVLTLQLIELGMFEANPVMAAVMEHSTAVFVSLKLLLTGLAILVLVYFARVVFFNVLRTGLFLTLFFCLYCCLICYELISLMAMT
ncbi:MAG: DUF5658 family protein [Pseudomonadota bacterium]